MYVLGVCRRGHCENIAPLEAGADAEDERLCEARLIDWHLYALAWEAPGLLDHELVREGSLVHIYAGPPVPYEVGQLQREGVPLHVELVLPL
jgi:hypothetical protein